jgi:hypothetical protein
VPIGTRKRHHSAVPADFESIPQSLTALDQALLKLDENNIQAGGRASAWNWWFDEVQRLFLIVRESPEVRAHISALVGDESATVRQWAAARALFWDPVPAREELERQASDPCLGLNRLNAEMILREFDAGRLRSD